MLANADLREQARAGVSEEVREGDRAPLTGDCLRAVGPANHHRVSIFQVAGHSKYHITVTHVELGEQEQPGAQTIPPTPFAGQC